MTDRQQIFDRIKHSAAYADRASRALSSDTGSYVGAGCGIAFMVVWCLMTLAFTVGFFGPGTASDSSFPGCIGIIPALMLVFGIAVLAHLIRKTTQYSNATTQATPAIVVSKHSRGGGDHSSNHITLEFEDGQRQEYRIGHEKEAALVGVGDAGVAFTRLDVFLAFDRVP
jgi:hypothetical protein